MLSDAIRNPLAVRDRELFSALKLRVEEIYHGWHELELINAKAKAARRSAKVGA
jgi:hypothetical protein